LLLHAMIMMIRRYALWRRIAQNHKQNVSDTHRQNDGDE
jgi:hypothetical protein